jgi:hypothetical protein
MDAVRGPDEAPLWTLAHRANPWLTFHLDRVSGGIPGARGHGGGRDGGRMGHRDERPSTCRFGAYPTGTRSGTDRVAAGVTR